LEDKEANDWDGLDEELDDDDDIRGVETDTNDCSDCTCGWIGG